MLISLYTLPNCEASELTRAAFLRAGIPFTERSAVDQSPLEAPVVSTIVDRHIVAWRGHRADMIDLLADLISDGPVLAHGLREREAAEEAVLTRFQVMQEIRDHQLSAEDFFADHGNHPLYRGRDLLNWLGY